MEPTSRATWGYKVVLFFLFLAAYLFFYILPNFRPLMHPAYLPRLDLDYAMPLIPWTFVVYLSDYLLVLFVILSLKELDEFNAFARMMFYTLILCGMFFLFFPTAYPRPPYPAEENPLIRLCMYLVHEYDTPNNCFPSMHVALTGVSAWSIRHKGTMTFLFFLLWSGAIFLSTLTTKQHYFLDILGGAAVVFAAAALDRALVRSFLKHRFPKTFLFNKS